MNSKAETIRQVGLRLAKRRFLVIFLPLAVVLGGVLTVFYYAEVNSERIIIETGMHNHIVSRIKMIEREFQLIVSDLMFLSEQNELLGMLESGETGQREALAAEYFSFSSRKGLYDQIRFLDETGMEVVRVNFNNGSPNIVPDEQLQSKEKRYYFEDTFVLDQGGVFVSLLDLNIERGEIEQPQKPMIRFGTSVFDSQGQKRGVVLLNYLSANLILDLELALGEYGQIILLNSDGFWLKGITPEDEWGFMYQDKSNRTFGNDFPEAWQRISQSESGQFRNADGMFTYTTVYPLLEGQKSSTGSGKVFAPSVQQLETKQYFWKLVSYVSTDALNAGAKTILGRLLRLYAAMLAVLAGGCWAVVRAGKRHKRAESALGEERKRLAATLRSTGDGVITTDVEGKVVLVNRIAEKLTGWTQKEAVGKPLDEVFHVISERTSQRIEDPVNEVLKTGRIVGLINHAILVARDGTERIIADSGAPIHDEHGSVLGVVLVFRDITKIRQAEKALRESETRLTEAQAVAHMGNWSRDLRTNELVWSRESYRIFGLSHKVSSSYENFVKSIHPEDREFVIKSVEDALKRKKLYNIEFRIILPGGKERNVQATGKVDRDNEGRPLRFFGIMQDITERKQAEEKMQVLYQQEKALRQKLEIEMKKRMEFSRALVHELKTPLTPIMSSSELLVDHLKEQPFLDIARNIYRGATKLTKRIDELLDLARGEIGMIKLNLRPIDLLRISHRVADEMSQMFSSAEQSLTLDLPPSLPKLRADGERLQQVIMNLLTNSSKFTPRGGKLILRVKQEEAMVIVEVQDNGPGIREELQERLFNPYYRVEGDRERMSGLGLGLALCKTLIELHGGRIWVESRPGAGATFSFTIPIDSTHRKPQAAKTGEKS